MTVRGRKRIEIGPLRINLVSRGFMRWRISSWSIKIGRWSWNSRTRKQHVDLPGPWGWTEGRR